MKLKLALVLLVGSAVCLAQAENVVNAKPGAWAADAKISSAKAELETGMKPYVRVSGGVSLLADSDWSDDFGDSGKLEYDEGYVLGIAAGLAITNSTDMGLRLEAEFGYQENDIDTVSLDGFGSASIDGNVKIMTFMLNGYIDFRNKSFITPYLMAGIGAANVEGEIEGLGSEDDTVFAGQVGAGLAFAISENVSIDTEYRYFMTDDPDFYGTDVDVELSGHRLQLGVRYTFN
jgi:opacity protein-like surface antigen